MSPLLTNFLLFQAGWFCTVLAGNTWALIYTLAALVIHDLWVRTTPYEWLLILVIAALGTAWDSALTITGFITFPSSMTLPIPLWLICLWLLFATTFNHSFKWLQQRLPLAALIAAVAGPISYLAGSKLTHVELAHPLWISMMVMAAGWAIIFPLGLYAARWLPQQRAQS